MCNGKTEATSQACQAHACFKWSLCLLLALAVVTKGQGSGCVSPYMVENSWVNHSETNRGLFPVGTVLQYSCEPGYLPDSPNILTCISPGRWSSEPPHCTQSSGCMRPFMEQHISSNLTDTNIGAFPVGAVLQYRCDPGYQPDGPTISNCTALGHWTSEPPRCIRTDVCRPPYQPENGGYTCHPSPCGRLSHGTVIEYFCGEGYILKGEYKYLTCQYGTWDGLIQISCIMEQDRDAALPLGMPTLSIVSSTASSVALILLLVVLFVLLQPKLKTFHRREEGLSGHPVSIMVEGVEVTLPSYEEAVSPESRVHIVLSEGQPQVATPEAGPSRPSSVKQLHSEMAVVHPLPPSSSSSPLSSSWTLDDVATAVPQEDHGLPLLDSEVDCSDGEAFFSCTPYFHFMPCKKAGRLIDFIDSLVYLP
ncbi:sushi domain-containing protein 4-like isoform X1 [Phyllopteryx taeniolatus]|uniref:sushi domain-containing protein 4-like isoform X1 n=2 Tax=Phyllopteryx taeniolatus TaxID=161469 RepID=UPI002AD4C4B7|nr:sushi domain-containing protein 4-like isoform X1 [Phyllopteryx taeniolatus]XP_061651172.1 sushi domain-containing protein 4-like isoform X1 [Phyllopteryx taeniolatus]XP_061651173.1 sushi domain-containing protein 4-like isoform X1 [Phyllopteryx taeniolatus]